LAICLSRLFAPPATGKTRHRRFARRRNDVALVSAPVVAAPPPDPNEPIRSDYELAEPIRTIEAWDFFLGTYPNG